MNSLLWRSAENNAILLLYIRRRQPPSFRRENGPAAFLAVPRRPVHALETSSADSRRSDGTALVRSDTQLPALSRPCAVRRYHDLPFRCVSRGLRLADDAGPLSPRHQRGVLFHGAGHGRPHARLRRDGRLPRVDGEPPHAVLDADALHPRDRHSADAPPFVASEVHPRLHRGGRRLGLRGHPPDRDRLLPGPLHPRRRTHPLQGGGRIRRGAAAGRFHPLFARIPPRGGAPLRLHLRDLARVLRRQRHGLHPLHRRLRLLQHAGAYSPRIRRVRPPLRLRRRIGANADGPPLSRPERADTRDEPRTGGPRRAADAGAGGGSSTSLPRTSPAARRSRSISARRRRMRRRRTARRAPSSPR